MIIKLTAHDLNENDYHMQIKGSSHLYDAYLYKLLWTEKTRWYKKHIRIWKKSKPNLNRDYNRA